MFKPWKAAVLTALCGLLPAVVPAAAQAQAAEDAAAPVLHPRFAVLPPHTVAGVQFTPAKAAKLAQWNGQYVDLTNKKITFTMVGKDATKSNAATKITAYIIPIKMVYGASNGNMTFDPMVDTTPSGSTVIEQVMASPLFNASVDYVQGGVDLGKTQYIDAYQRGNFWSTVSHHPGYHVLLNATVLPEQTINVTPAEGSVVSGYFTPGLRGLMDMNAFDAQLQTFIAQFKQINPSVFPLFVTDNVFLTSGVCCIGGYHSATAGQPGGQTYGHASYINSAGSFAQDVSAMSHEIGEWMDDPFVNTIVNCRGNNLMEVGDPLEGGANYGGFPYSVGNFTYNLQSLVFLPYFGAPASTSVNGWLSFQNDETKVCRGQ
jgi:hypothetical protein